MTEKQYVYDVYQKLSDAFESRFGDTTGARFFFAPSRINLIGEHIDYNGGAVFPCAIEIGTYGLARPNQTGSLRLASLNFDQEGSVDFPLPDYDPQREWMNYPAGVARALLEKGYAVEGCDVVIYGDIPNGAGLSSSASVELLFGVIFNALFNENQVPVLDLVQAGVACENEYFGLHTGIMDQYVIGFGRKDQAMVLDTSVPEHTFVPFHTPGAKIVILNTNKRRELKDSKYNERRDECERALAIIQKQKNVPFLCALEEGDMKLIDTIEDAVLRKRAAYVVEENLRVKAAVTALQSGDLEQFGTLLRHSNAGLRDQYEVTGKELDAITEAANAQKGCYGARMTGAGFGGCGIALVQEEQIPDFCEAVGRIYLEQTGREAQFILSDAGDGAREVRLD